METRLNSVTLWYSLSDQGRKDAFAGGVAIDSDPTGRSSRPGAGYVHCQSVSADQPELFQRAARLAWIISEDGATADLPVGSPFVDVDRYWIDSDWSAPVPPPAVNPYLVGGRFRDPQLHVRPAPVLTGEVRPEVLGSLDLAGGFGMTELADEPEEYLACFTPFHHYPTVEELVAKAEQDFADAERAVDELEANADMPDDLPWEKARIEYEAWLDLYTGLFHDAIDIAVTNLGAIPVPAEVLEIRSELEDLDPYSSDSQVRPLLTLGPARVQSLLGEAIKHAEIQEATAWSLVKGSRRLRRIAEEGLLSTSMAVYRDERLAADRPGWAWRPSAVTLRDPVAPTEEAFDMLDAARQSDPTAVLRFATLGKGAGVFVATSSFFGNEIWFPADALASIEAVS